MMNTSCFNANNKGADQPVHLRSLVSILVAINNYIEDNRALSYNLCLSEQKRRRSAYTCVSVFGERMHTILVNRLDD